MADAKPVIELAGRVPVEHVKIDPAPAALGCDCRKPRHQPPPDTKTTCGLHDIEIFEVQPRAAKPSREAAVEQGRPGGFAVKKRQKRLEARFRPEAVAAQVILSCDDGIGRSFVGGQLPDQLQQQAYVVGGREADRNAARSPARRKPTPRTAPVARRKATKVLKLA